jgi:hypothetical protein
MRFRDIFDISIGRLILPQRPLPPGVPGEMSLEARVPRVRATDGTAMRLLTDLEINQPGGVAGLDSNGELPPSVLPPVATDNVVGEVRMYSGDPLLLPAGYLVLDGSEQLKAIFPKLARAYGSIHGVGSSSAVFKLPNYIARSPLGTPVGRTGRVGAVHVLDPGAGFTDGLHLINVVGGIAVVVAVVEVAVSGGKVLAVRVVNPGNYSSIGVAPVSGESNCGLTIPPSGAGGGVGFKAQFVMRPDALAQRYYIRVVDPGAGYVPGAQVLLGGSLRGATAQAVLENGRLVRVIVTDPGNGDLNAPSVGVLAPGGGAGAVLEFALFAADAPVVGDWTGEDSHAQNAKHLAPHTHTHKAGGPDGTNPPWADQGAGAVTDTTSSTGEGAVITNHSPTFGVVYFVKAE